MGPTSIEVLRVISSRFELNNEHFSCVHGAV
jgi:hypothetical protein